MTPILQSRPLSETILFNQEGVRIIAHIDYKKEVVSFVDENGKPFGFVFACRGIDYLGGWLTILNALKAVTIECNKRLWSYKENQDQEFLYEELKFNNIPLKEKDINKL